MVFIYSFRNMYWGSFMTDAIRMWHVYVYGEKDGVKVRGEYVASAKSEKRLNKLFKGKIEIIKSIRADKDRILIDMGVKEVKV